MRLAREAPKADLDRARSLLASALLSGQSAEDFHAEAKLGTGPSVAVDSGRFEHFFVTKPITAVRVFARTVQLDQPPLFHP